MRYNPQLVGPYLSAAPQLIIEPGVMVGPFDRHPFFYRTRPFPPIYKYSYVSNIKPLVQSHLWPLPRQVFRGLGPLFQRSPFAKDFLPIAASSTCPEVQSPHVDSDCPLQATLIAVACSSIDPSWSLETANSRFKSNCVASSGGPAGLPG